MPGCIVTTDTRFVRVQYIHASAEREITTLIDIIDIKVAGNLALRRRSSPTELSSGLVAIPVALLSQLAKPTPARRKTYISAPEHPTYLCNRLGVWEGGKSKTKNWSLTARVGIVDDPKSRKMSRAEKRWGRLGRLCICTCNASKNRHDKTPYD